MLSDIYLADCKFLNNLVSQLSVIITNCGNVAPPPPPLSQKVVSGKALEYATDAIATDVVTLTLVGYVQYIYYQVYATVYPETPNSDETIKIYEIYDALNIPRPIL